MNNNKLTQKELIKKYKKNNQAREILSLLSKNKAAMFGLIFLVLLILVSLGADLLYDYDAKVIEQNISERLQWPSLEHPFGTDDYGRDLLARVVHGSRMSLYVSFLSVAISLILGGILGAVSGYYGGVIDNIIMRITDIFLAIPMTLLAMVIVAALGANTINLVIALSVSSIPTFARIVRGSVLTVREVDYIEAASAIGAKDATIIFSHILPNCMGPIIVQTTLRVAATIANTAALSFLGLGVQAPAPEWGALLSAGRNYIRDYSYLTFIPGLAIMLTILALNLLGDGLRDALDPRLK
ncbi:MAG TPA: ABC transporter permease [Clostridiales bacterium]|nr:ABC transporter permease [Clostridiales bacterium]